MLLFITKFVLLAAATQVKFNRKSEYLIASAHDKDVKIWDLRVSFFLKKKEKAKNSQS